MATGALTAPEARRARPWREVARLVVAYLLLTLGTLTMGIPFLWMVVASVQSPLSLSSWPPELLPPWPPLFSNYPKALTSQPFHLYFFNSGKIAVLDAGPLKVAIAPVFEILGAGAAQFLPEGESRFQVGLPLSVEVARGSVRMFASTGFFTRGAWFAGGGAGFPLKAVVEEV